jgi:hypothetical protein
MIFISTGGKYRQTAVETALDYYEHNILGVELSGGVYSETCVSDLLALPDQLRLQVHNYFPPPKDPFVFNLASGDTSISQISVNHVRSAMRLATALRRPVYSFHAGFRINPRVNELGRNLALSPLMERQTALDLFCERVTLLAEEARQEGVSLLIENNVINEANFKLFGEDPLLLTHPEEISTFMGSMPSNVGLLLDVAHLKVSGNALGFDIHTAHKQLQPWIKAYHLSDNDGTRDSNNAVSEDSWFWDDLVQGLNYYSLEVYQTTTKELVNLRDMVAAKLSVP